MGDVERLTNIRIKEIRRIGMRNGKRRGVSHFPQSSEMRLDVHILLELYNVSLVVVGRIKAHVAIQVIDRMPGQFLVQHCLKRHPKKWLPE